jgi:hypothetical protein
MIALCHAEACHGRRHDEIGRRLVGVSDMTATDAGSFDNPPFG